MKGRTIHFTWMAFTLAAVGMLGLQTVTAEPSIDRQPAVSYSIERTSGHSIQPVSLPVVTRQVNQAGPFTAQQQSWTF